MLFKFFTVLQKTAFACIPFQHYQAFNMVITKNCSPPPLWQHCTGIEFWKYTVPLNFYREQFLQHWARPASCAAEKTINKKLTVWRFMQPPWCLHLNKVWRTKCTVWIHRTEYVQSQQYVFRTRHHSLCIFKRVSELIFYSSVFAAFQHVFMHQFVL